MLLITTGAFLPLYLAYWLKQGTGWCVSRRRPLTKLLARRGTILWWWRVRVAVRSAGFKVVSFIARHLEPTSWAGVRLALPAYTPPCALGQLAELFHSFWDPSSLVDPLLNGATEPHKLTQILPPNEQQLFTIQTCPLGHCVFVVHDVGNCGQNCAAHRKLFPVVCIQEQFAPAHPCEQPTVVHLGSTKLLATHVRRPLRRAWASSEKEKAPSALPKRAALASLSALPLEIEPLATSLDRLSKEYFSIISPLFFGDL
jgi:hypothetical protein